MLRLLFPYRQQPLLHCSKFTQFSFNTNLHQSPVTPMRDRKMESAGSATRLLSQTNADAPGKTSRSGWLLLWAGWLLPQLILLGPALIGKTVYSPVDLLALPGFYLPNIPEYQRVVPRDSVLSDLILNGPAYREFTAKEFRAGRLPLWRPANFAGAPFATMPIYSPFEALHTLVPRPVTLAWMQLIQVVTFGLGMWLFLRYGLRLSYWPAVIVSWCAPLSGFITLWQGYGVIAPLCWLPWSLLLAKLAVRQPWGWSTVGVAGVTALILLSGQSDVGGLVLLTTGLFAVWLMASERVIADRQWRSGASSAIALTAAWLTGFCLAAPFLMPLMDYTRTGSRMQARAAGYEERPPVGLSALPAIVQPDIFGSTARGSLRIVEGNKLESSSTAYAGLLALLWLAPLAWCHPRYRRETIFLTLLAIVALGWTLKLPGLVHLMRLKPFNMLPYNRWTFATCCAVLILAGIGLEHLFAGQVTFRRWFWVPILVTAGFGLWCLALMFVPPEPLYSQAEQSIRLGRGGRLSLPDLQVVRRNFAICYGAGALFSLAALLGWRATSAGGERSLWWRVATVALLPAELLWFAAHEGRQADRSLYFPRIPALEKLAQLPSGRIWGVRCLPPDLNFSHGLEDIRGYDAVDPEIFVKLFDLACNRQFQSPPYAKTQFAVPTVLKGDAGLKLHPVADLLNVRYLVLRTPPPDGLVAVVHQDDYWVIENPNALPRAWVPRSVRNVTGDEEALQIMSQNDFAPREVVLMSEDPGVPSDIEGAVAIQYEAPGRARLDVEMLTDGIVVVSDMWDAGWRAELDGVPSPIHRVNVALRGVRVPSGKHTVIMTYEPRSVRLGFQIAGAAGLVLFAWMACLFVTRGRTPGLN